MPDGQRDKPLLRYLTKGRGHLILRVNLEAHYAEAFVNFTKREYSSTLRNFAHGLFFPRICQLVGPPVLGADGRLSSSS